MKLDNGIKGLWIALLLLFAPACLAVSQVRHKGATSKIAIGMTYDEVTKLRGRPILIMRGYHKVIAISGPNGHAFLEKTGEQFNVTWIYRAIRQDTLGIPFYVAVNGDTTMSAIEIANLADEHSNAVKQIEERYVKFLKECMIFDSSSGRVTFVGFDCWDINKIEGTWPLKYSARR
jgi:hypothetical protein